MCKLRISPLYIFKSPGEERDILKVKPQPQPQPKIYYIDLKLRLTK